MQKFSSTKLFSGFLLIACIVQACYTAKVSNANSIADRQLMCYVCEDCAKVTKETPLEACDAAYFEKVSTTEEPTTDPTTTTTTTSTESSTTTELSTTTTVETTTAGSTTEAVPTPSTVGPAPTTTTVPTPPTVGSAVAAAEEVDADNATTTTTTENALNATTTGAPQALPYVADDYSYHCFSVQKMVNGTTSLDRGCSRVTTMESVCDQLRALNNGTQLSKCVPCSNSSCNGSSALGVSVAALMFTLVAALLSRQ